MADRDSPEKLGLVLLCAFMASWALIRAMRPHSGGAADDERFPFPTRSARPYASAGVLPPADGGPPAMTPPEPAFKQSAASLLSRANEGASGGPPALMDATAAGSTGESASAAAPDQRPGLSGGPGWQLSPGSGGATPTASVMQALGRVPPGAATRLGGASGLSGRRPLASGGASFPGAGKRAGVSAAAAAPAGAASMGGPGAAALAAGLAAASGNRPSGADLQAAAKAGGGMSGLGGMGGGGGGGGVGGGSDGGGGGGLSGGPTAQKPTGSAGPPAGGGGADGGAGGGAASGGAASGGAASGGAAGGGAAGGGAGGGAMGGGGGGGGGGGTDSPDPATSPDVATVDPVIGTPQVDAPVPSGETLAANVNQPASVPIFVTKTKDGKEKTIKFTGPIKVDADGVGGWWLKDKTDQLHGNDGSKTSARYANGDSLNPGKIPFIVVPMDFGKTHPGVQMGDYAAVTYGGRTVYAIVGDRGPNGVVGEGSIALARSLKINSDPNSGGVGAGVTYVILPGTKGADLPHTAAEIQVQGKKLFDATAPVG